MKKYKSYDLLGQTVEALRDAGFKVSGTEEKIYVTFSNGFKAEISAGNENIYMNVDFSIFYKEGAETFAEKMLELNSFFSKMSGFDFLKY